MKETIQIKAEGMVKAQYVDTGEVILDTHNDIHLENLNEAIALALGNFSYGIEEMHFGNGGSVTLNNGELYYKMPRVTGQQSGLYNPQFFKVVNDRSDRFTDNPVGNNIKVVHTAGSQYSDIVVTCTLGYNEPANQQLYDDATAANGLFIFDEMCLMAFDNSTKLKKPLSHVMFHPIQKAYNRALKFTYTIRLTMV